MNYGQYQGQRLGLGAIPKLQMKHHGPSTVKTPFMVLHEKYPLVDRLLSIEEINEPNKTIQYRCSATIATKLFSGEGSNKKMAKQVMAQHAIRDLMPHLAASLPNCLSLNKTVDLVSQTGAYYTPNVDDGSLLSKIGKKRLKRKAENSLDMPKEPLLAMLKHKCNERSMAEGVDYLPTFNFEDISPVDAKIHERTFRCTLTMPEQGKVYKCEGNGKRLIKLKATKEALMDVFECTEVELDSVHEEKMLELKSIHPLSKLNEAASKRGLKVNTQVEPVSGMTTCVYKCTIRIDDKEKVEAEGATKKAAKIIAACRVLKEVFDVSIEPDEFIVDPQVKPSDKKALNMDLYTKSPAERLSPLQLLNQLCRIQNGTHKMATFELVEETKLGKLPMYVMKVKIGDREFTGQGPSKKAAKVQAARQALRVLFLVDTPEPTVKGGIACQKRQTITEFGEEAALDIDIGHPPAVKFRRNSLQTPADVIHHLVHTRYAHLREDQGLVPTRYLAAFVLTRNDTVENGQVISLATGAKTAGFASVVGQKGLHLLDCHAEVLARRGLLLFFYQQLSLLIDQLSAHLSIFEPAASGHGYQLKPCYRLHFYCTFPPSGDARITGQDQDQDTKLLRCHRVNESGSSPIKGRPQQTWTSLHDGREPLMIMSISDKILKWNSLGLQGGLLSHFVEPIYMSEFCIGTDFHRNPVIRAIYGRLHCLEDEAKVDVDIKAGIPPRPIVSGVTDPERLLTRPRIPSVASVWTAASPAIESIIQETGKEISGKYSRLCKSVLFEQFDQLCAKKLSRREQTDSPLSEYRQSKETAFSYQSAKKLFIYRLSELGYGSWQSKPSQMENFKLSWAD